MAPQRVVLLPALDRDAEGSPHDVRLQAARARQRRRHHRSSSTSVSPTSKTTRLQSHDSTSARSAGVVTFTSLGSPSTTATRPPTALDERRAVGRTREVARERPPQRRSEKRLRRLGRDEPGRGRRSPRPRHRGRASACPRRGSDGHGTVEPLPERGRAGARPRRRRRAGAPRRGRARPERLMGTSKSAAATDAARVAPPVTQATTFDAASSSASRIAGSSQPGGAATTIASTSSHRSSRSRLSASSGRPPRPANAFGRSIPSRSPEPAAAMSAQVAPTSEPPEPLRTRGCGLRLRS